MNQIETASLYALHCLPGVGNRTLWRIKQELGSFRNCLEGDHKTWQRAALAVPVQELIRETRQKTDSLSLLNKLAADDIKICTVEDDEYPQLLRNIFDPPYLFYYRGDLSIVQGLCIAVVGARAATNYGKVQARRFGQELARENVTVVSGMARGIDTEAHRGALAVDGKTTAILGCGLKVIYPPENKLLYRQICEVGLVLSEFPPEAHPEPGHFPMRNRTISGLSRGVLVIEAKIRSGALITADFALEQGRDVFAIPGPINSQNSAGTNNLIKQGAGLVSSVGDILAEYGLDKQNILASQQGELNFEYNPQERQVLTIIGHETVHFDYLLVSTQLDISQLSTLLLQMELGGIIRAMPGNYYAKI